MTSEEKMKQEKYIRRDGKGDGFSAYYYSFDSTGNELVDNILKAVAGAGASYHNTEDWNEEYENSASAVECIQTVANESAEKLCAEAKAEREIPSLELIIKIIGLYETLRVEESTLPNGQWCEVHREVTPQEIKEAFISEVDKSVKEERKRVIEQVRKFIKEELYCALCPNLEAVQIYLDKLERGEE